jgi:hypothetical protein
MRRLRQKIEVDPNRPVHLLTVRGVGYRLVPTETDSRPTEPPVARAAGGPEDGPAAR